MTGMVAPMAKVAKLDPAAPHGEPRSSGSSPSSSRTSVSRACSGFLSSSAAIRAAWSGGEPLLLEDERQLGGLLLGRLGQLAPLELHLPGQDVALGGHRGELAHRHGEGAGEQPGEAGHHQRVGFGARRRRRRGRARGWRAGRRSRRRWRREATRLARRGASARAWRWRHGPRAGGLRPCRSGPPGGPAPPRPWEPRRRPGAAYLSASPASLATTYGMTASLPSRLASQIRVRTREEGRSGGMATPSFSSLCSQTSAWRRSPWASSAKLAARSAFFSTAASPS